MATVDIGALGSGTGSRAGSLTGSERSGGGVEAAGAAPLGCWNAAMSEADSDPGFRVLGFDEMFPPSSSVVVSAMLFSNWNETLLASTSPLSCPRLLKEMVALPTLSRL